MIRRILLIAGLALLAFDIARLNMTGVAVAGVVLMLLAGWLYEMFTPGFWVADPELSDHLDLIDQEASR